MTIYDIYGETEPVTRDYPGAETAPPPRTSQPHKVAWWEQFGRDIAYVMPSLLLSTVAFVLVLTLISVGVSTVIIWIGLPITVFALLTARAFASIERVRLRALGTGEVPEGLYPAPPSDASAVARMLWPLRQPQYWLDALWGLVGFVTSVVSWTVSVTWLAMALGGTTFGLWRISLPTNGSGSLAQWIGLGSQWYMEVLLNTAIGIVAAVTLPWVMRATASLHAVPAAFILNSTASLRQEIDTERRTRQAHQEAEATALRRLERDIHDGPQQRLVRLSMDLGRAMKQVSQDPDKAVATIDDALQLTRDTIDELRSLTRGIAPPLLVDRGLVVALNELVNRASIPVALNVDIDSHLSPAVETAVYFTVSEALTNIAKHSMATTASIEVREREGFRIDVIVEDNGLGGAHESKGNGLAGLRARVEGVGGLFVVDSPDGGPTSLHASLPTL